MTACPYCPTEQQNDFNKTQILQNIDDKTKVMQEDKTTLQTGKPDFNKIAIFSGNIEEKKQIQQVQPQGAGRKLVGWLVSYTLDPLGQDFKLREGRNIIGSDSACDICVPDAQVSGKHLTILYRMGDFKFKDELSTNGTFVNDEFVEEGNLKDGDIIRIGQTSFKFRSAL
ncbi:MAG: FHA domain-containing protein [Raineya sp.]